MNKKLSIVLLTIFLTIISIICIGINGKTYTIKVSDLKDINTLDELDIKIENDDKREIVKCTEQSLENGVLKIKIESVSEGKTYIDINKKNGEIIKLFSAHVHKFGIITIESFFGDCNGSIIIPISVTILLVYILYLLINEYRKNVKESIYQYKNISYLGLIIFLSFSVINQLFAIFNYNGFIQTIRDIIGLCSSFSILLLPVAFLVSILVLISNIVLIKNEGLNLRNFLGLLMGAFFCFSTIFPEILNQILYSSTWIDVHNEQGIGMYIQIFVETVIYVCVSYLECILLGAIIVSIKAAKKIPEFNKDFIIILGCKVKKDGTLTNLLKARVDRAIEFEKMQKEKTGKELIFIPSGGQGMDETISEAQAMKNYLLEIGVKEENILIENKSKNTYENIKFSNELIKNKMKNAQIAFSTTNYHVYRAGALASRQGIKAEGIGAKTKTYFWINAFIREFIAALYSERKEHFSTLFNITTTMTLIIGLFYLSNAIL